jgi:hypothetical protein
LQTWELKSKGITQGSIARGQGAEATGTREPENREQSVDADGNEMRAMGSGKHREIRITATGQKSGKNEQVWGSLILLVCGVIR